MLILLLRADTGGAQSSLSAAHTRDRYAPRLKADTTDQATENGETDKEKVRENGWLLKRSCRFVMSYKADQEIAEAELNPTNSTRLGLALNFAVFYYEIMSSPDQACTLGKQAFMMLLRSWTVEVGWLLYESTLIRSFLADNLTCGHQNYKRFSISSAQCLI
ncbi:hypothetical protein Leryth_001935 [Lithospermum erythrorhizon]|nr:hypothetical protein Leryth_001935 [Lithospermum erythrorhizon]